MKIGPRIKELRVNRRVVLSELSKKTGLTTSFLSQLERGLASASVSSLEKIARALCVKIVDFFQDEEDRELIVVRKNAGRQIIARRQKVLAETLACGPYSAGMRSQIFRLGASAAMGKELIPFQGEKFMMVLKGRIEFFSGKEKFAFKEGDSVYCVRTRNTCRIKNIGKGEAKIFFISFFAA